MPRNSLSVNVRSFEHLPAKAMWDYVFEGWESHRSTASSRAQFWTLAARKAAYSARILADNSRTNIRQIERYCRKELGRSPQEWLNEQRIIAARKLLAETGSVKRAALELGFKQVSHFCRHFKKAYRMTPSEFLSLHTRLNDRCR